MTLERFERLVLRVANSGYHSRYFIHLNYPERSPWLMGLSVVDRESRGVGNLRKALEPHGITWDHGYEMFVAERTDDKGEGFD